MSMLRECQKSAEAVGIETYVPSKPEAGNDCLQRPLYTIVRNSFDHTSYFVALSATTLNILTCFYSSSEESDSCFWCMACRLLFW